MYGNRLNLFAPTIHNGQTHLENSSAFADELFECLTILWGWPLKGKRETQAQAIRYALI